MYRVEYRAYSSPERKEFQGMVLALRSTLRREDEEIVSELLELEIVRCKNREAFCSYMENRLED